MASFADTLVGKDAVTAVNQFCQRFAGRVIMKDDILYTTTQLSTGGHQCALKMMCLDGVEFAGEVCNSGKDAKMSAAQQVLDHYAAEIAGMPAQTGSKNGKKRKPGDSVAAPEPKMARLEAIEEIVAGPQAPIPANTNKADLNTTYSKIIRRVTQKGEITYNTGKVVGGYQSQVQLPGLPEPWCNEIWAGEVHAKKSDAEQSVARVALDTIRADPSLMAAFARPPKPNQWMLNGGMDRMKQKGGGKGPHSSAASSSLLSSAAHDSAVWNQTFAAAMAASGQIGFSPMLS